MQPLVFSRKKIREVQKEIFVKSLYPFNNRKKLDYSQNKVISLAFITNYKLLTIAKWYPIEGEIDTYNMKLTDINKSLCHNPGALSGVLSGVLVKRRGECGCCVKYWENCLACPLVNAFHCMGGNRHYLSGCTGILEYTPKEVYEIVLKKLNVTVEE